MKKLLLLATGFVLAMTAQADILYWQVANPSANGSALAETDYAYAAIQDSEGNYLSNVFPNSSDKGEFVKTGELTVFGAEIGASSSYAQKTFFIELFDADLNSTYKSDEFMFKSSDAYVSTANFNAQWKGMTFNAGSLNFTATGAVPEPTSGMLLLMGAALLGLRRRKMV